MIVSQVETEQPLLDRKGWALCVDRCTQIITCQPDGMTPYRLLGLVGLAVLFAADGRDLERKGTSLYHEKEFPRLPLHTRGTHGVRRIIKIRSPSIKIADIDPIGAQCCAKAKI